MINALAHAVAERGTSRMDGVICHSDRGTQNMDHARVGAATPGPLSGRGHDHRQLVVNLVGSHDPKPPKAEHGHINTRILTAHKPSASQRLSLNTPRVSRGFSYSGKTSRKGKLTVDARTSRISK